MSESETSGGHRLENEKQAAEISATISPNARKVDRERVTPMFLKMYCRIGGHHRYRIIPIFHFHTICVELKSLLQGCHLMMS